MTKTYLLASLILGLCSILLIGPTALARTWFGPNLPEAGVSGALRFIAKMLLPMLLENQNWNHPARLLAGACRTPSIILADLARHLTHGVYAYSDARRVLTQWTIEKVILATRDATPNDPELCRCFWPRSRISSRYSTPKPIAHLSRPEWWVSLT